MMEWFSIIKRRNKRMQGNIPHFYHWLTRIQRTKAEHTDEWLQKYCAWEDLPKPLREYMKDWVMGPLSKLHRGNRLSGSSPIPGIQINWQGSNFTVDEDYYNNWRNKRSHPKSQSSQSESPDWSTSYKMNNIYKAIQRELKYCAYYRDGTPEKIDWHHNRRFYGSQKSSRWSRPTYNINK